MYTVKYTRSFKRSLKKLRISGTKKVLDDIETVVDALANGKRLEHKYKDHALTGELQYYRECHIRPDLLLIYQISKSEPVLFLVNIGSHSLLFG